MSYDKDNTELISVIIPTYNRMRTLERSVNSVLNQTYANLEILIIDDGSDDGTEAYVKSIEDDRIRYYRNERNMGPSASRNRGAKLAKGTFLAFQDSDDEWEPDKLMRLTEALDQAGGDTALVYHEMQEMDGERAIIPSREIPFEKKSGNIFAYMLLYPLIGIPAALIKKSCFDQCGGFCEGLKSLEDYEFFLRVAQDHTVLFVGEPLIRIYDTPGSVNKRYKDKIDTEICILDTRYDFLRAFGLLQKKIELIRMQAENYDCEDYFYEQILKLCDRIPEEEKKEQIRRCARRAATASRQTGEGDRAAYYQNAAGQLERLTESLDRLRVNFKQNPALFFQNREGVCRTLLEVAGDLRGYTDLAFHPQSERLRLEELETRLKKEQNCTQPLSGMLDGISDGVSDGTLGGILDGIYEESRRLLGQINEAQCTCTVCGSAVRFLPPSPYCRVMRDYYGYREKGTIFLFEGEKDRCPVCGATQELRFLVGFLGDVRSEGDEKLKVLVMGADREENAALAEGVRRYANQRADMEYLEPGDPGTGSGNAATAAQEKDRNRADVVICAGVLEQADSDKEVFRDIGELLADRGVCVLMVSAIATGKEEGGYDNSFQTFGLEGVRRQYTESGLIVRCEEEGFAVSVADENWFGSEYYEQCGFMSRSKLFMLTKN